MKKIHLFSILLGIAILVVHGLLFAASGGDSHGHGGGLTDEVVKTIIYQTINVVALVIGLIYFVRAAIRNYFQNRNKNYLDAAQKATHALRLAEESHLEIKLRLSKLKENKEESLARARAEANDLKKAILDEAHQLSKTIRHEAEQTAKREVEKAKNEIKNIMIQEARNIAEESLKTGISKEEHARLTGGFLASNEGVGR